MYDFIYNLQRSGKMCLNAPFNVKEINIYIYNSVCSEPPTDVAENIWVMFAFSSATGHNSNHEISIRYKYKFMSHKIMHICENKLRIEQIVVILLGGRQDSSLWQFVWW